MLATEELWQKYSRLKSNDLRNELIMANLPLVKYAAKRIELKLSFFNIVSRDDIENSGVIGLIRAVERYKPESGTSFGKFAYKHIYGAMMDEMRRQGWYPKRVWKKIKNVIASQELGDITETNEKEASMLNHYAYNRCHVPLEKTVNYSCGGSNMLLKYALEDETSIDPLDCIITEDEKKILYNAINKLPEREKTVIISYYFTQMDMGKIGEKLHLSRSRVCQLHKKALDMLRSMLLCTDGVLV